MMLKDCARIIDAFAAEDGQLHHPPLTNDGRTLRDARTLAAASALAELAHGVLSLVDVSFVGGPPGVHVRVAIASDYHAIDPMLHTNKCPLWAYMMLEGLGTEYIGGTRRPWEYAVLRALGVGAYRAGLPLLPRAREAGEMEFVVMKGDG